MQTARIGLAGALAVAASVAGALGFPGVARANPRPLPFTYTTETLGKGEAEIEQFVDLTPVRLQAQQGNGAVTWAGLTELQTELEYGLTDRLELGLYVSLAPTPAGTFLSIPAMPDSNGVKQRLRYVFADPDAWPVDVGVYGEVVENDREIELEAKLLLQRRFGQLRVATNLWAEYELYYEGEREVVLNPTLGATYQITPTVHVGAESWMRAELPIPSVHPRPFGLGPHLYAGPTLLLNFGKVWTSAGVYVRATDADHTMQPGEPYGPVWGRMVVGVSL